LTGQLQIITGDNRKKRTEGTVSGIIMKTLQLSWGLLFAATLSAVSSVSATVFTTSTNITAGNTSYEGTDIVISNCTVTVDGAHSFNSLLVAPSGILTHSFVPTGDGNPGLDLTITNDVTVASGASINASGIGYGPGLGTGSGSMNSGTAGFHDGSGGGHGGNGGISSSNAPGGICYGSVYQPATLGSGGGMSYAGLGGSGGGSIQITANGNLNSYCTISHHCAHRHNEYERNQPFAHLAGNGRCHLSNLVVHESFELGALRQHHRRNEWRPAGFTASGCIA
jgi:hypothetical protein